MASKDLKCRLGMHHYKDCKEMSLRRPSNGEEIAKIIILQCENCGKLKKYMFRTVDTI